MKTLKSFLVFAIFLVSTSVIAQPPGGGQGGGHQGPPPIPNDKQIEKMVDDLAKELSLSTEKEEKVLGLYKAHFTQVKAKTSGNSRPKREEMEALDATLEKNVKAELTKEQITKYDAHLKKQKPPKQ